MIASRIHAYVVRYDSGFAPNPFFGFCTLATCKPEIRRVVHEGHWVVGTGSADKNVKRGGHLVYAMQITEILTFERYWADSRFLAKRPNLRRSKMHACGDNIYHRDRNGRWQQLDSFHSKKDGSPHQKHTSIDTRVDRVLVSEKFVYFGGEGPLLPEEFRDPDQIGLCPRGRAKRLTKNEGDIQLFAGWLDSLGQTGQVGRPLEWLT